MPTTVCLVEGGADIGTLRDFFEKFAFRDVEIKPLKAAELRGADSLKLNSGGEVVFIFDSDGGGGCTFKGTDIPIEETVDRIMELHGGDKAFLCLKNFICNICWKRMHHQEPGKNKIGLVTNRVVLRDQIFDILSAPSREFELAYERNIKYKRYTAVMLRHALQTLFMDQENLNRELKEKINSYGSIRDKISFLIEDMGLYMLNKADESKLARAEQKAEAAKKFLQQHNAQKAVTYGSKVKASKKAKANKYKMR